MFAGHVGAALAIGRVERRVNVGVFFAAALLLDFVLWILVLLGWESISIPAQFVTTHQAEFVFPYSHSLLAGLLWSGIAAAAGYRSCTRHSANRRRLAALLAAAVFSHWLLDALVHRPELPLAGAGSPLLGLSLWSDLPVALSVEAAILLAGLALFVTGSTLPRASLFGLAALSVCLLAFTVAGMTLAPAPPSALAMAGSSLVTLLVACLLAGWLGRSPHGHAA